MLRAGDLFKLGRASPSASACAAGAAHKGAATPRAAMGFTTISPGPAMRCKRPEQGIVADALAARVCGSERFVPPQPACRRIGEAFASSPGLRRYGGIVF